jgi:hypothetical protein
MKNFFRATKVTWVVFPLPFFIFGFLYWSGSFATLLLGLPMLLWEWVGLPVGHSDYFGFFIETPLNLVFTILTDIFVFYFFASTTSWIWYKFKPKSKLPSETIASKMK